MQATTSSRRARAVLSGVALWVIAHPAIAQAQDANAASESPAASDIIVTGSRFGARILSDSPTPIDSISNEKLNGGGGADLSSSLKVAVPSFSTPRPSAAGASDFLQSPTMRGLSTGELLVLVNGKRRHTNSDLNTNNQIGRGDVAYDFTAIPAFAIKSVEVLRDGAAAQYGSDAIGGVMNVILDDSVGYRASARVGTTTHGDGEHYEANLGAGFKIGEEGVLRLTAQYIDHHHTDRALPDTRQQYFGTNALGQPTAISGNYGSGTGLTPSSGTLDPREATFNRDIWIFGEPDYKNKSIFANFKMPLGAVEFYAFGGYNYLKGTSYNFVRRSGQDETVRSIWPDGFLPINDVRLENVSGSTGLRGDIGSFKFDLSTTYGANTTKQTNIDANNASLGNASPTKFYRGASHFEQWTTNLDFSTEIPMGDDEPLRIAFGGEYRKEWYELRPGELASYVNGGATIIGGPNDGRPAPVGSQPVAGISPSSATKGSRNAKALYAEVEKTFFDRLLLTGALRYEDYSDFGSTTNFKAAARFKVTDTIALRGSYGTGFRAPALAQILYNSATTNFVNGAPLSVRFVSVRDPIAALIGAPSLKPEKSRNLSAGAVITLPSFTASIDYYRIKLRDRIALSSNFQSAALTNYLAANGHPGITAVSFVTNGIDTTTKGVDVTATWRHQFSSIDTLTATLAANFNDGKIDNFLGTPAELAALGITTPTFDLTQRVRLTDSTPKDKISLDLTWKHDRLRTNLTVTRYGKVSQVSLTGKNQAQVDALLQPGYDVTLVSANAAGTLFDIVQHFGADVVTDLEVSYDLTDHVNVAVGASNLFDEMPDKLIASTVESVAAGTNGADNNGIFPYAYIAPYGTSGRFVYARISVSF